MMLHEAMKSGKKFRQSGGEWMQLFELRAELGSQYVHRIIKTGEAYLPELSLTPDEILSDQWQVEVPPETLDTIMIDAIAEVQSKKKAKKTKLYGVQCLLCKDELYSMHRHDWVSCKCGAVYIDGGQEDYIRIGGEPRHIKHIEKPIKVSKKARK